MDEISSDVSKNGPSQRRKAVLHQCIHQKRGQMYVCSPDVTSQFSSNLPAWITNKSSKDTMETIKWKPSVKYPLYIPLPRLSMWWALSRTHTHPPSLSLLAPPPLPPSFSFSGITVGNMSRRKQLKPQQLQWRDSPTHGVGESLIHVISL